MQILNETLGAWKLSPWRRTPGSRLREAAASLQDSGTTGSSLFFFLRQRVEKTAHIHPPGSVDFHQASPHRGSPAAPGSQGHRARSLFPLCLLLTAWVLPGFSPRPSAWHPSLAHRRFLLPAADALPAVGPALRSTGTHTQQALLLSAPGPSPTGRHCSGRCWQPHRTTIPSRALLLVTTNCSLFNGGFVSLPLTKTGSSGSWAIKITRETRYSSDPPRPLQPGRDHVAGQRAELLTLEKELFE